MFRPYVLAIFYVESLGRMLHFAGFFTDKRFCSSLPVDSLLQRLTLTQMTTKHNCTLLRHSNPLQICVTTRNLVLRHSQNLVTSRQFSSSSLARSSTLQLEPLFQPRFHYTHSCYCCAITPLDLDRLHFFVHRLNGWTCVFRLLSNLPRSNPGAIRVYSRWYSGLFSSATLLRHSLFGHRSASKPVVAGALRTQHNPRPSAFTVRLSHGLGMQLRVG